MARLDHPPAVAPIIMEGVGTALRKRGYPAMDDLKSSKQR
jgi:hypothetical protein